MALTSAPYGLVPINLLGGQGFAGSTRLYSIPSGLAVNIQTGDPVIVVNTGSTRGTITRMNTTTTATTVTSTGGGFGFVGVICDVRFYLFVVLCFVGAVRCEV